MLRLVQGSNMRIVSEAFSIAKLGIVINSSINFFLYCLSGRRFQKELAVMICSRLRSDYALPSSSGSSQMTSSSVIYRKPGGSQMTSTA